MRQLKITKSITNRDAASLDKYLHDISQLPMITADEETVLAQRIRKGDRDALSALTIANLRFVVSVAKQYQNQGVSLQDLINEGNLGLMKAAERFDETRGFKFISYAVWWIRQSITQAISEQSRLIRIPLNKVGMLGKIRKAQSVLEQQLERKPTNPEIAEKLELTLREVDVVQGVSAWHMSFDAVLHDGETGTLLDTVADADSEKPDGVLITGSLKTDIGRAMSDLTDRERDILMLFYGIGHANPFTLPEIAERFDLTRERVRQIKEKAMRKLRHSSRSNLLKDYL